MPGSDDLTRLRYVLAVAYVPPEQLLPLARAAEELGYDAVAVADHLLAPVELETPYPYGPSGRPPFLPETPWCEPWAVISAMAAVTERVEFLTNVFILPLRDPFTVAKSVSTASVLSGGRVQLGIGVGWMREEFAALGRRFEDRGRRTDEMIEVMRLLWSGGPVEFHGRHYEFPPLSMQPAPAAAVPVLVGGNSNAALDRAARLGDGYIATPHRVATLGELAGELDRRRAEAGAADRPFDLVAIATDATAPGDHVALARSGVTSIVVTPWGHDAGATASLAAKVGSMERFGVEMIAPVRAAGIVPGLSSDPLWEPRISGTVLKR